MDDIKKEFKQFRGCFIFLGVLLVIAIFGGLTALLEPKIGDYAPLAGLGGALLAILVWIGLAKNARWAKVIAGIPMAIGGLGISVFILWDFVTSFIKGESLLKTDAIAASSYGQSVFIILATGIALIGVGIYLIGWWKWDKK